MRKTFCTALLFLAALPDARATTEVNASARLLDVKTIAVMPVQCPPGVDCLRIEQIFLEKLISMNRFSFEETQMFTKTVRELTRYSNGLVFNSGPGIPRIIPCDRVRRVLFENSLSLQVPSERAKALTLPSASTFLAVRVGEAATEQQGAVAIGNASGITYPVGTNVISTGMATATSVPIFTNRGSVEVLIMDAEGTNLLQGSAYGESAWRKKTGLLGSLAGDIVTEGFEQAKRVKEQEKLAADEAERRTRVPQLESFAQPGMKIADVLRIVGQPSSMNVEVTPDRKLKQIAKYVSSDRTEFVVVFISGTVLSVAKSPSAN